MILLVQVHHRVHAVQYHLFSTNAASLSQKTIGPTVEVAAFKVHPIAPNP